MRYLIWLNGQSDAANAVFNRIGATAHMMDGPHGNGGLHSAYLESDDSTGDIIARVDETIRYLAANDVIRRDGVWDEVHRNADHLGRSTIHYNAVMYDGTPVVLEPRLRNYDMGNEGDVLE